MVLTKDYNVLVNTIPHFKRYCSLQKFMELRTIIGSRNFGLWIDGTKQATMVPLGDMLNHSSEPDVKWSFEEAKDGFVMNSVKTISAHREITDSYGTKCNRSFTRKGMVKYHFIKTHKQKGKRVLGVNFAVVESYHKQIQIYIFYPFMEENSQNALYAMRPFTKKLIQ